MSMAEQKLVYAETMKQLSGGVFKLFYIWNTNRFIRSKIFKEVNSCGLLVETSSNNLKAINLVYMHDLKE